MRDIHTVDVDDFEKNQFDVGVEYKILATLKYMFLSD